MNFKNLLDKKIIEKIGKKKELEFDMAERDLNVARDNFLSGNFDWALNIAYNAVLISGRELMFFFGYRPIGKEHHKAVFEFLRESGFDLNFIEYFDKIRKKRNKSIYGEREEIYEEFCEEVIQEADKFVHKIRTFVQKNKTGDEDETN